MLRCYGSQSPPACFRMPGVGVGEIRRGGRGRKARETLAQSQRLILALVGGEESFEGVDFRFAIRDVRFEMPVRRSRMRCATAKRGRHLRRMRYVAAKVDMMFPKLGVWEICGMQRNRADTRGRKAAWNEQKNAARDEQRFEF